MPTSRAFLYELADAIYKLAPWRWLEETDLIAVHHPETNERFYLSLMGAAGNHTALAVYLGEESLHRFNLMQQEEELSPPLSEMDGLALVLESRQLQVSFGPRGDLAPSDLSEIKKLGRKYRGENWPYFRSYRPGFAPAPITSEETLLLQLAMEQFYVLLPTLAETSEIAVRNGPQGAEILTRQFLQGQWKTSYTPHDMRNFTFPQPAPSELLTAKIARLKPNLKLECIFQLMPTPVGPSATNAVFPYLFLCVDRASEFILGMHMLSTEEQSHEALIASVPDRFLQMCDKIGAAPTEIHVSSHYAQALLQKTAAALNIPLKFKNHLPTADRILMRAGQSIGF